MYDSVAEEDDAMQRMLTVVRWYMSGWHLYPKNCKKPYNPVLGEQFVAFWDHGTALRLVPPCVITHVYE